mmetsp:Transcript_12491/g.50010  ORF Transcript_12491/g.50010 Transcript_12491/m.50010 type:complete len:200 (-) Transcript_12491:101-700(-)
MTGVAGASTVASSSTTAVAVGCSRENSALSASVSQGREVAREKRTVTTVVLSHERSTPAHLVRTSRTSFSLNSSSESILSSLLSSSTLVKMSQTPSEARTSTSPSCTAIVWKSASGETPYLLRTRWPRERDMARPSCWAATCLRGTVAAGSTRRTPPLPRSTRPLCWAMRSSSAAAVSLWSTERGKQYRRRSPFCDTRR